MKPAPAKHSPIEDKENPKPAPAKRSPSEDKENPKPTPVKEEPTTPPKVHRFQKDKKKGAKNTRDATW